MLMDNTLAFWDTETSSIDPNTTQVLSIGCVMVNPRKLEIIPNSEFYSLVKPTNEATVEAQALEKNKLKLEDLREAPELSVVWPTFARYLDGYKKEKTKWGCPVQCGYNITEFDSIIAKRYNQQFNIGEMWHPFHSIDVMLDLLRWRHNENIRSISFDNTRKYMGMSAEGAHNSLQDAKDSATLGIKFLLLYRSIKPRFENCFGVKSE